MKKFLLNRIREGEFDPCQTISKSLIDLESSYSRANNTIHTMHGDDEVTLEESLSREFLAYSRKKRQLLEMQLSDEHKKLSTLQKELSKLFGVDVWEKVIDNTEFDTLEELYENYKSYIRDNNA